MVMTPPSEPNQAEFEDIWANAAAKYSEISGQRRDDTDQDLKSVDALLCRIDSNQAEFSEFREKRHTLFKVLRNTLKPVEAICHLATGGASEAFPPSGFVFSAVIYLIEAGRGVSACYDAIIDLFAELEDFTTRLRVHVKQHIPPELRKIVIDIILSLLNICNLSTKVIKEGRVKKFFKAIVLGKDEKVEAEMATLRRLTESEERMVGTLTFSTVSSNTNTLDGIDVNVGEIRAQLSSMNLGVKDLVQEQKDEKNRRLLENFLNSSSRSQEIYENLSRRRIPDSGNWIREQPTFQAWVQREKPILWLYGGPGTGKSFMSSNVIEYLTQLYPQGIKYSQRISVAYFFCKDYDRDLRSFNKVLRSLAYQICQNNPLYAQHCLNVLNLRGEVYTTEAVWRKLFVDFFQKGTHENSVILLIDGLDEAFEDECKEFLELLCDLQKPSVGNPKIRMQIAMLGRPVLNRDIDDILDEETLKISVSPDKTAEDMDEYVKRSIAKVKLLRRVPQDLRNEVVRKLFQGAQGMFLWVDLMVKEISEKQRIEQIRQTLTRLPRGLPDTIRHVLQRFARTLTEDLITDLNELLAWVTCAQRQLTLSELDAILRLKSSDGEGIIDLEGELRYRYASFFTLTREDGRTTEDLQRYSPKLPHFSNHDVDRGTNDSHFSIRDLDENDFSNDAETVNKSDPETTVVSFAHASIGDFFRQGSGGKVAGVGIDIHETRVSVAKTCLNFWCSETTWETWQESKIVDYAFNNWPQHLDDIDLCNVPDEGKNEVGILLMKTIREEACIKRWSPNTFEGEQTWLCSETCSSTIARWFKDEQVALNFDDSDKDWVASLSLDIEVFVTVINAIATEWLKNMTWHAYSCFNVIYNFLEMLHGSKKTLRLDDMLGYRNVKAAAIYDAADWTKFEKDSLWHRRLADTLRVYDNVDEAILEYETALALGDNLWLAYDGLARCYAQSGQYEKAIQTMQQAQKPLPAGRMDEQTFQDLLEDQYDSIGWWYQHLNNHDMALESFMSAYKINAENLRVAGNILDALYKLEKYQAMIHFMKELQANDMPETGISMLVRLIQDMLACPGSFLFRIASHAARETSQLDFLRETIKSSLGASRKSLKVGCTAWLQYWLGMLMLREYGDEASAIHIWEQLVKASVASKPNSQIAYAGAKASNQLSVRYFDRALTVYKGNSDYDIIIKKLKKLSQRKSSTDENDKKAIPIFDFSTNDTTLKLGKLYQLMGEQEHAKECFKPHVKLGIDLLMDEDFHSNRWRSRKLYEALRTANDDEHAAAAYSGTWRRREGESDCTPMKEDADQKVELEGEDIMGNAHAQSSTVDQAGVQSHPPTSDEPDELIEDDHIKFEEWSWWRCMGPCYKDIGHADDRHSCRICDDTDLCKECLKLVRENKTPFLLCNPKHEFYKVPPMPKRLLRQGTVMYKGEEVRTDQWLEVLRRDWNL